MPINVILGLKPEDTEVFLFRLFSLALVRRRFDRLLFCSLNLILAAEAKRVLKQIQIVTFLEIIDHEPEAGPSGAVQNGIGKFRGNFAEL